MNKLNQRLHAAVALILIQLSSQGEHIFVYVGVDVALCVERKAVEMTRLQRRACPS